MKFLKSLFLFLSILITGACIDRLNFDIGSPTSAIVIDGYISDQPGPYTVKVNKAFDIESKLSTRMPVSIKELSLSDDRGNHEVLTEVSKGIYQTSANGIRGVVGHAYKIHIELLTGEIYESRSDTIPPPGKLDSVFYKFRKFGIDDYAFDIYFDASNGLSKKYYFLWKFTGTFKVITNPEFDFTEPCSLNLDCKGCSICNFAVKCSGIRNIGKTPKVEDIVFIKFKPCECCICWYNLFNADPILSDNQFVKEGRFNSVKAGTVPVHQWIFQNKVYAEVSQRSLTHQSYTFYKAIKDQKDAVNSLFQPITGKIPRNFIQMRGTENPVDGLFFATSISSKNIIITSQDVPDRTFIFPPTTPQDVIPYNCLNLFPNSSTIKPAVWED